MTLSRWRADSANSAPKARIYPWRRDEVETVDRASAEVADEAECEETEEKVRSGDEYEEMAGVAGTEGEGEMDRTGGEASSASRGCGSSMAGDSRCALAASTWSGRSIGVECAALSTSGMSGHWCLYYRRIRVDGDRNRQRIEEATGFSGRTANGGIEATAV